MMDAEWQSTDVDTQGRLSAKAPGPLVSVVVPTFNRVGRLRQVVAALERQQFPADDYEIIIVSDGSTDGTDEFLEGLRSERTVRWFSQSNRGPAAARNRGIGEAVGEFIVFVDDDVVAEPQLLSEHIRAHREASDDVVVLGPLISPSDFTMRPWVRWEQEMLMKQYRALLDGEWRASARQFYTGNASVKRSHVLAVGGFDENFRRAEDVELAYRLAALPLGFVFKWEAGGMHYAERSFRSWLDTAYDYGRNDMIFVRDRDQKWLVSALEREFRQRNILIRWLVRACIDRRRLRSVVEVALKLAADAATAVHASEIERYAYSGLFNLNYYCGLHDESGKACQFLRAGSAQLAG